MFDYLIVGAGFAGSVLAERLASQLGKKVLICDKRPHIGGNAHDHLDAAGILVHDYGPHIFHTASARIFAYLSQFTRWRDYQHRVKASIRGQLVPFPINVDTVNMVYGTDHSPAQVEALFARLAVPMAHPRTSEQAVTSKIGRELYELFFQNYTRKQWGLDPSELDASVAARVPARTDHDDRYFTDEFQAMPLHGFTRLFENLLRHPNIQVITGADYLDVARDHRYREMIYTGPVDAYFDHRFGKLPYRSIDFTFETHDREKFQEAAVVNYPNDHDYTRITEFKYLTGQQHAKTTVVYERPTSSGDPYYPVPRPENAALYDRYKALAGATRGVRFVGRLATYRYYNMDQVVGQSLSTFDQIAGVRATATCAA